MIKTQQNKTKLLEKLKKFKGTKKDFLLLTKQLKGKG